MPRIEAMDSEAKVLCVLQPIFNKMAEIRTSPHTKSWRSENPPSGSLKRILKRVLRTISINLNMLVVGLSKYVLAASLEAGRIWVEKFSWCVMVWEIQETTNIWRCRHIRCGAVSLGMHVIEVFLRTSSYSMCVHAAQCPKHSQRCSPPQSPLSFAIHSHAAS